MAALTTARPSDPLSIATLKAALQYAGRGWPVIPMYAPGEAGQACTCGRGACKNVGKHPATTHGVKDATIDPDQIHAWWSRPGRHNLGIATGAVAGLVVLDVDAHKGGFESLQELVARHGPLPITPEAITGGSGRHYLFAHPGVPVKSKVDIAKGLDVRADGSTIVAPPSLHRSGNTYEWAEGREPGAVPIAPAPSWLLELANGREKKGAERTNGSTASTEDDAFPEGQRNARLASEAGRLRREGLVQETITAVLLEINRRRCQPPLDDEEVRRIAASVSRYAPESRAFGAGRYVISNGMMGMTKKVNEQEFVEPLCNFTSGIVAEIVLDDGYEVHRELHVAGKGHDGRDFETAKIPSDKFEAMNWPLQTWGGRAILAAGNGTKSHLRAAIQLLSPPDYPVRRVYRHSGWRNLGGLWYYLHAGGAIGADGALPGVEVSLEDRLAQLRLPEPAPKRAPELADAVRASLELLEIAPDPVVGAVVLGGVYRAMLAEAAPSTAAIWIEGPTGSFKSQIAALAQAHYGAAFWTSDLLPTNWSSTANAIERVAFVAKDAALVVDDFAPTGSRSDQDKLHQQAERLIRSIGNQQGRGRMTADVELRKTYVPRGFILSTGEDIPRGQSLKARLVVVSLEKGTIDQHKLTLAQSDARAGKYALAMSGFARWLAPRLDTLRATLRERAAELRQQAARAGLTHRRTPDNVASLFAAWETFLEYAQEDAGLDASRAREAREVVWRALISTLSDQAELTTLEDPVTRFFDILRGAMQAGRCYVTKADGSPPDNPASWGWVSTGHVNIDPDPNAPPPREAWTTRGSRIGILPADAPGLIYLYPEPAFRTAKDAGAMHGDGLAVGQRTLWRRMRESGKIVHRDEARNRNTIRRKIDGQEVDVVVLSAEEFGAPHGLHQYGIDAFNDDAQRRKPGAVGGAGGARASLSTRARVVLELAEELQAKAGLGDVIARSDLLTLAEPRGVSHDDAYRALDELVKLGQLRETEEGSYRVIR